LRRDDSHATNATGIRHTCQLFGWKCPKTSSTNGLQTPRPGRHADELLTAARREFAQSGLAGARVDEIAARAGVNKQLVYHYFGDKDALYLAVLEWVYEELRAKERELNLEGLPPEQAIRKADRELLRPSCRASGLHLAAERRKPRRRAACARFQEARALHSPLVSMVSKILAEASGPAFFRKAQRRVHLYIQPHTFPSTGPRADRGFRRSAAR